MDQSVQSQGVPARDAPPPDPQVTPIVHRDARFEFADALAGDWHGGSAARTAVFNALSLMFPVGERFFIETVQEFLEDVKEPDQRRQIVNFCRQEATHGREHGRFNQTICARAGCEASAADAPVLSRIADVRRRFPKLNRLASTVAYEHLTAILASEILRDPRWLERADPRVARLWTWHAIEETEHKAVAFDLYRRCGGSHALRLRLMRFVLLVFFLDLVRNLRLLLRRRRGRTAIALEIVRYLFGRGGLFRALKPALSEYFAPDFHPWQDDNRPELAVALRRLAADGALP